MIEEFAEAWGENEARLTEYLKANIDKMEYSYLRLVQIVFDEVINPYLEKINKYRFDKHTFSTDKDEITEIDNGEYQGTLIFAIHENGYQSEERYVFTAVDYGSCSGCDTLMEIESRSDEEDKIRGLKTLCLHLLQQCVRPFKEEDID